MARLVWHYEHTCKYHAHAHIQHTHTHTQLFKFIDLIPNNGSFKENLYSFSMRSTFYRCCQFFGKDIALPLHIHVLYLFISLYLLFIRLPPRSTFSNRTRIHALSRIHTHRLSQSSITSLKSFRRFCIYRAIS